MASLEDIMKQSVKMVKTGRKPLVSVPSDMPEGTILNKKGEIRLPKSAAACADLLYRTREERLGLQRQLDKLSDLEGALKNWFIENLPKSNASGIAGKVARVQIETKPVPQVADWDKFYHFVKKYNAFELLQRRLNEGAVKERLDDKQRIPGVTIFQAKKVSCTKL